MILDIIINNLQNHNLQSYKINWKIPKFKTELGEYFENDYTQNFLKKHGIVFDSKLDLLKTLKTGNLIEISKTELFKTSHNISNSEDFYDELKNTHYAESFNSMESELKSKKVINLPAPILLNLGNLYYGFSGNRRTHLGWKYNIPVKFWVVKLK